MRVTLTTDYRPGQGAIQVSDVNEFPPAPFSIAIVDRETKAIKMDFRVWQIAEPFLAGSAESEDVACCEGDAVIIGQIRSYSKKFVFRLDSREF